MTRPQSRKDRRTGDESKRNMKKRKANGYFSVDLGGSLAVASVGLYATGVSTDLNVTYLSSGGKVGDVLKAVVRCDKCGLSSSSQLSFCFLLSFPRAILSAEEGREALGQGKVKEGIGLTRCGL